MNTTIFYQKDGILKAVTSVIPLWNSTTRLYQQARQTPLSMFKFAVLSYAMLGKARQIKSTV